MLMSNRQPAVRRKGRRGGSVMERLWLRHYPPGVPAEIDPSRYPSLVAMLEEGFKKYAAREACVCMGKALTFARAR